LSLDLKERTKRFAIRIIFLYKKLPVTTEFIVIGKQLLRSATSVGANTRASFRSRSKKEFISKINIVIEEADESVYWLELLETISKNDLGEINKCKNEAEELLKIFASIKSKYKE
jgi:four helix bundle protein